MSFLLKMKAFRVTIQATRSHRDTTRKLMLPEYDWRLGHILWTKIYKTTCAQRFKTKTLKTRQGQDSLHSWMSTKRV